MNADDLGAGSGIGALLGGGLGTLGGAGYALKKMSPALDFLGKSGASGRLLRALAAPRMLGIAGTGGVLGSMAGGAAGGLTADDTSLSSGAGGAVGGGGGAAIGGGLGLASAASGLPNSLSKGSLLKLLLKPAIGAGLGGALGASADSALLRHFEKTYRRAHGE